MSATCIARIVHGSRLFGTNDAESDTDVKSIWLPSAQDILLGRTNWTVFDKDDSRRNCADDVDQEQHDLIRYLNLVAAGQPAPIEMLFAPESAHDAEPHELWHSLTDLAPLIVPASVSKFMGYLEEQAAGFGIGGDRITAVEAALGILEAATIRNPRATVGDVAQEVVAAAASPHVRIDVRDDGSSFLLVAGRSTPFENKIAVARRLAWSLIESFRARGRKLAAGDKRNWKAVSHSIRLAEEALELSTCGIITLPRPNAGELVEILRGRMSVAEVILKIERLIPAVASAARSSPMPKVPDTGAIEDFVVEIYGQQVAASRTAPGLEPFM